MKEIRKRQLFNYLLLALYICYYSESNFFFHTHTFDWGTVTHSHPYIPSGGHTHSQTQCLVIASLTNLIVTLTATFVVAVFFKVVWILYVAGILPAAKYIRLYCPLRGPPVSVL
ncbi:MAG: hypothetical protein RR555_11115 [Bacteroidales bacterium]